MDASSYCQTHRVVVTSEGAPYDSGHFAAAQGESLTADRQELLEYRGG
jgi:hypothetical protein